MTDRLDDLQPAELWQHFLALNAIPRPSGHEQGCQLHVKGLAEAAGVPWREDDFGNLVLYVDGSPGPEVAVQAHFDMVCEKLPGVEHDFFKDPIDVARDGDRIFARGTTLGADNAIGAAAALALMTTPNLELGPLELVFTVQEETGLHGAIAFDPELMSAGMLINLDSEDPNTITVGCAGGSAVEITVPLATEAPPTGATAHRLTISGARGGHSGVNIHEGRASAIKVLLEVLGGLGSPFRLAAIEGGSAHNVIPRDATATVVVEGPGVSISAFDPPADEPDLHLAVEPVALPEQVLDEESSSRLLGLLRDLPHGVLGMSEDFEGKVETSANLARVETAGSSARVLASVRSFIARRGAETQEQINRLGTDAGGTLKIEMGYPGWEPDPHSELLRIAREQFERVNGRPPIVEVLHAGLECGVLVDKKPGTQAISFGPTISGAHSPSEFTTVSSVSKMWELLLGILREVKNL